MTKFEKILVGASLLNIVLAGPVMAQQSGVRASKKEIIKEIEKSPFSGSFEFAVGSDSNAMVVKNGTSGSFYQISPSLSFSSGIFNSSLSASIKDFSDQQLSNNAKDTAASLSFGINTKIFGDTQSSTGLALNYSDSRWPDLFGANDQETLFGAGMPVRYTEGKISQSLGWTIDRLNLKASGSYAQRNYTSRYSDWSKEIFGPREFENDQKIANANLRVGIKLSDNIEIGATPSVSHKQYTERPARETDGSKAGLSGNAPMTEFITNDLRADLSITAGPLSLTPYVVTGVQMDQATGGEDYTKTGGGLDASIMIVESINLKLSGSIAVVKNSFDNWSYALVNSTGNAKREDDESNAKVAVGVDLSKSVGLGLAYEKIKEESTYTDTDENYSQEIISTNVSIRF